MNKPESIGIATQDRAADPFHARDAVASPAPDRPSGERDHWADFLQPDSSETYLKGWLSIFAGRLDGVRSAYVFLRGDGGQFGVAARWGNEQDNESDLADDVGAIARKPDILVKPVGDGVRIGTPVEVGAVIQAIVTVDLEAHPHARLSRVLREVHWATGWLAARLWRGRALLDTRQKETARLVMDFLAVADQDERIAPSALAVVNAVPDLTGFDLAAISFLRNGRSRLTALSRTATFQRKARIVSEWQAVADEVAARGEPISVPASGTTSVAIDHAHRTLLQSLGLAAAVSVPLVVRGNVVGAMTVARRRSEDDNPELDPEAVDDLRLVGAAIAPVLWLKVRDDRWFAGRLRDYSVRAFTAVFGRRPAIALGAALCAVLIACLSLAQGDLRVRADAVLQGRQQRSAVALIDGFVRDAFVRAGDTVEKGTLLAQLDDRDAELQLTQAEARRRQAEQRRREALALGDRAAGARAAAEISEAASEIALAKARLDRTPVIAPQAGLVVSGDLSQRLGTPVSRGDLLFEIASLDAYRVLIDVSEYDIGLIVADQTGELVLTGLSDIPVNFVVTGVSSVAEPQQGENRFRVEADVIGQPAGVVRPGMEGVAKIEIGPAPLWRILLRGTMDRLRILLWRFLP